MGCDIHFYVEKRINGKWTAADKWVHDKDDGDKKRLRVPYEKQIYRHRNYNLFAILADVRNERRFAGTYTSRGFNPISAPKGVPDDASPEYKQEVESWDCDGHSHSWLTVAELLAFDWTQHNKLCGWLNGPEFERWSSWGREYGASPNSYCGDVSGPGIKKITEKQMMAALKKVVKECESKNLRGSDREKYIYSATGNLYCFCEWTQQYFQCAGEFLGATMPVLWRLGKPEDVRIVFFFDN